MTTRVLRPLNPTAPATTWMHPDDAALERKGNHYYSAGLIYRFYDANQDLLYIGQTTNGHSYPLRWTAHRRSSPWWELVAFYAVDRVSRDLTTRLALEKVAIRAEHPRFNKQHVKSRSSFMVFTREGAAAVVEQIRTHLLPEDFDALAAAFAAEHDRMRPFGRTTK